MRFLERRGHWRTRHGKIKSLRASPSSLVLRPRQSECHQRRGGFARGFLRSVTCPACGTKHHEVLETREVTRAITRRRHRCEFGHRWTTRQTIVAGSWDATDSVDTTGSAHRHRPPDAAGSVKTPPVVSRGGRGGSALRSGSDPHPDVVVNPIRARAHVAVRGPDLVAGTDRKIAALRRVVPATPEQLEELRKQRSCATK